MARPGAGDGANGAVFTQSTRWSMRTLVVVCECPCPATSGSRLRLLTTLDEPAEFAHTERVAITARERNDFAPSDGSFRLEQVS